MKKSNVVNQPLEIQKIEKKILFGTSGPWTKYFNALMLFGIDVPGLYIENALLKEKLAKVNQE